MRKNRTMRLLALTTLSLLGISLFGCAGEPATSSQTPEPESEVSSDPVKGLSFQNPIGITGIGDPFVFRDQDGKFYLYATSVDDVFYVWVSDDLTNWERHDPCYKPTDESFAYKNFWAPEVIYHDGKYIMHYTARWKKNDSLRIGVAVADSPLGPFVDVKDGMMFDLGYSTHDGHVFRDDDGQNYFYFVRSGMENWDPEDGGSYADNMMVAKLSDDCLSLTSEPVFLFKATNSWENAQRGMYSWNEGPFMVKNNGKYYLMFSANAYYMLEYCVGYAVSDSPMGSFEKPDNNPVLTYREGEVSGTGHNSVFKVGDELICAYHVHTKYNEPNGNRQVFFDKMHFEDGLLYVDGPTLNKKITIRDSQ